MALYYLHTGWFAHWIPLSPVSPGYKPFLNVIKPQLQRLSDITEEQIQPESAFQPANKAPEQAASPRAEENRSSACHSSSPPGEAGNSSAANWTEGPMAGSQEEEPFQDGTYDCTVS